MAERSQIFSCDNDFDWAPHLRCGETLLWSGRPEYGRRFSQSMGQERQWRLWLIVGTIIMWATLGLVDSDEKIGAMIVYLIATMFFAAYACFLARTRAYMLNRLFYAVTDRRAILCRIGRDVLDRPRKYVVSCAHDPNFTYEIVDQAPGMALTVGHMVTGDAIQPFGYGLTHPGWKWGQVVGIVPILFEQIESAADIRDEILRHAEPEREHG